MCVKALVHPSDLVQPKPRCDSRRGSSVLSRIELQHLCLKGYKNKGVFEKIWMKTHPHPPQSDMQRHLAPLPITVSS